MTAAYATQFWQRRTNVLAQSNKSRTGREATKKRVSYRRRGMTKEEQVVGLIFQVTMWAYIAAAAAYVVIG